MEVVIIVLFIVNIFTRFYSTLLFDNTVSATVMMSVERTNSNLLYNGRLAE